MGTREGHSRAPRLDEKRALITGGARGIGRAIADRFVAEGASVVIADLEHISGDDPVGCYKVNADIADEASVKAMIAETLDRLGGIDILVHCAGIHKPLNLLETELIDWQRILDINLTGTFLCNREAARVMVDQKNGSIINIASVAAILPSVRTHAYATSKGGVMSFTKAIAGDLAEHGVRVNAIVPGPVETKLMKANQPPEFHAKYIARLPTGRYAFPEEIAGTALFLASEDAGNITGSMLTVDGGFTSTGVR